MLLAAGLDSAHDPPPAAGSGPVLRSGSRNSDPCWSSVTGRPGGCWYTGPDVGEGAKPEVGTPPRIVPGGRHRRRREDLEEAEEGVYPVAKELECDREREDETELP